MKVVRCSLCGLSNHAVARVFQGDEGAICNECLELANRADAANPATNPSGDLEAPPAVAWPPRGYERLSDVLVEALKQSSEGKGKERHARDGQSFEDQRIVAVNLELGSNHGAVFQAVKKAQESARLAWPAARRELLGAVVYLAAAVIVGDELNGAPKEER